MTRATRSALAVALAIVAVLAAACAGGGPGGATSPPPTRTSTSAPSPAPPPACPQAADGRGAMGACSPPGELGPPRLTLPPPSAVGAVTFPDLSNNNPVSDFGAIKRAGHPAVYLKLLQGTTFIDSTFAGMRSGAWSQGMAVGAYDFVSTYSAAEANLFVSLLRQHGFTRDAARTMPPVLDVEYSNATRAGVQTMVNIVRAAFGRVMIYTGNWYWAPRLGCWWPAGVDGWISGYPTAPSVCGLPGSRFVLHQFSDGSFNGVTSTDMNRWLGSPDSFRAWARLSAPPNPLAPLTARERKLITAVKPGLSPARKDAALDALARQVRRVLALGHPSIARRAARLTLLEARFNPAAAPRFLTSHERRLVYGFYGAAPSGKRHQVAELTAQQRAITTAAARGGSGGYAARHRGERRHWIAAFRKHRHRYS